MWKDFFYYTKSERKGVVVLLVIMSVLAIARLTLPYLLPEKKGQTLPPDYVRQLNELQQKISEHTTNKPLKGKIDPLQLDSSGFVKVGFTANQAHEIMELKRKNNPEDFYFLFMDYALDKNVEWVDHIDDLHIRE